MKVGALAAIVAAAGAWRLGATFEAWAWALAVATVGASGRAAAGACAGMLAAWVLLGGDAWGGLRCAVIVGAWGVAFAGARRLGDGMSGAILLLALAWLALPVWGTALFVSAAGPRVVAAMTWVHPAFALNRAADPTRPWTHSPAMYERTVLGQDVAYALPTGVTPCVVLHAGAGALMWGAARLVTKKSRAAQRVRVDDRAARPAS